MLAYDEALRLRIADDLAEDDRWAEQTEAAGAAPTFLARTQAISSYPTVAGAFYGVQLMNAGGTEAEGAAGSFGAYGTTFLALNVGSSIPPVGTSVLITLCGHRWVFRYD